MGQVVEGLIRESSRETVWYSGTQRRRMAGRSGEFSGWDVYGAGQDSRGSPATSLVIAASVY